MYFLYGDESLLIKNEIRKIVKQDFSNLVHLDIINNFEDLISSLTSYDLFSNTKYIWIDNLDIFLKELTKNQNSLLLKAIKDNYLNNIFIFTINKNIIDEKNEIIKFLLSSATTKRIMKILDNDWKQTIQNIVAAKKGTIDINAVAMLINKFPKDLYIITNEINKLLINSSHIDLKTVNDLSSFIAKEDTFGFINAFGNYNFIFLYEQYQLFLQNEGDIVFLISQISSYLEFCLFILINLKLKKTKKQISVEYKLHIFRIEKTIEFISYFGEDKIKKIIGNIENLDWKIKSGQIDKKLGFDRFLLQLLIL